MFSKDTLKTNAMMYGLENEIVASYLGIHVFPPTIIMFQGYLTKNKIKQV
jgi:hypothetical protein